ncbi:MAG: HD domain-containing protein [Spirochaetaceae bacterium]|nr:HD domain-containing protein [Spirochaetaceae bacterium]
MSSVTSDVNLISSGRPLSGSKGKILLVVSDDSLRTDYATFLHEYGYDVSEASDGLIAQKILSDTFFNIVIISFDEKSSAANSLIAYITSMSDAPKIIRIANRSERETPASSSDMPILISHDTLSDLWNLLAMVDEIGKNISLTRKINAVRSTIDGFLTNTSSMFSFLLPEDLIESTLDCFVSIARQNNGFIQVVVAADDDEEETRTIYRGAGKYNVSMQEFYEVVSLDVKKTMAMARMNGSMTSCEEGVVFPLRGFNNSVFGVIFLESKNIDNDILTLLTVFIRQAAVSINNAMMHQMLDKQSEQLMRINMQLNKNYLEVIQALREAVDAKDRYTHGHSERVSLYAVELGKKMGLSAASIENLRIGGIFHDIGKIAVKDEILLKKSRLTDEEYEQIKIHPKKGGTILSGVSILKDVVPIVEGHHENYDGSGYPRGLKGDEICIEARIMAIGDAFDAMTSNREYHRKISFEEALGRIEIVRGKQFDPMVVDAFADLIINHRDRIKEISEFFGNAD